MRISAKAVEFQNPRGGVLLIPFAQVESVEKKGNEVLVSANGIRYAFYGQDGEKVLKRLQNYFGFKDEARENGTASGRVARQKKAS